MAARKSPLFDTATTLGKIIAFLGISGLAGVLAAGLLVPVAAAAGTGASASLQFFEELPVELEREALAQPTKIEASDGSLIATLYEENRQPVTLDQVSQTMQDALISIEDYRYYEHGGVDLEGILGAIASNLTSDRTRGASTITQQFVNNTLIYSALQNDQTATFSGNKNVGDKLREMKLAIAVEKELSKDEILEGYLNIVQFSGTSYGVQAASRYFFNVDAKDLTIPQSALLAGVVNGPTAYSPTENPEAALERRNLVIDAMLTHGKITQEEHDAAVATDLGLAITPTLNGCVGAAQAPYFCDYVTHLILNDPAYGETPQDREKVLYRSGLTIKTTLDSRVQAAAQTAVNETANPDTTDGAVGHTMLSLDPKTGNILSMAQNTRYNPEAAQGNTVLNFNVDEYDGGDPAKSLGGGGGFQPGSTYKPFTVAAWVESGKALNQVVDGTKKTYPEGDRWRASCMDGGNWVISTPELKGYTPQNYGDKNYRYTTVLDGLAQSLNTVTMATARQLDLCRIRDIAFDMGVHDASSSDGSLNPPSVNPPALIGGGVAAAPMSMAKAFGGFANEGTVCEPRALTEVTAVDGTSYPVPAPSCRQTISKEVARGVNTATQEVMKVGSGSQLEYGDIPMAGKTGTNDERSQTWFMGYNSGMVTASWVGNWQAEGEGSSLGGLQIGGRVYPEIDGSLIAGPSWARFMQQIPGLYVGTPFAAPPASMINGGQRTTNPARPSVPGNPGNGTGTNTGGIGTNTGATGTGDTGTGAPAGGTTGGGAGSDDSSSNGNDTSGDDGGNG
ncbi:transglycosylase domain-containing protein [Arthrobacter agilis]|uniref:transglycosylase domain-containing protein n=1 Tax=Arthrobacter agilis TaxID=37921 RepID=UPI00278AE089|nr:transglycosylase domain-containing protein [Arthrobacter agilis]MDQ0736061.1 membrane peptidoglycan carboxypeptidase [Arthrobacter agilis]